MNPMASCGFAENNRTTARRLTEWARGLYRVPALALLFVFALPGAASAGDLRPAVFYVATDGQPDGDGSVANPWDLQTALDHPAAVKPGDTILLKGGTYVGPFSSHLQGTVAAPIHVKGAPGERAKIDGVNSGSHTLAVHNGGYVHWRDFEVFDSTFERNIPADQGVGAGPNSDRGGPTGIDVRSPGHKFINLVVHDTRLDGIGLWTPAPDSEIYGTLFFNNGRTFWDHDIYTQNQTGSKVIADNITLNCFGASINVNGSGSSFVHNYTVEGNTAVNAGAGRTMNTRVNGVYKGETNLLFGGGNAGDNLIRNNILYQSDGTSINTRFDVGWAGGKLEIRDNYMVGGRESLAIDDRFEEIVFTGNLLQSTTQSLVTTRWPGAEAIPLGVWNQNRYFYPSTSAGFYLAGTIGFAAWKSATGFDASSTHAASLPLETKVFIRPNKYESGRAHITVFNWANKAQVSVSLNSFLQTGRSFEIRDAENFFGSPVLSGVYDGKTVALPMNLQETTKPIGNQKAPPHTASDFGVFIVLPGSSDGVPPVDPPPPATKTASARRTEVSITVDGVLNECAWSSGGQQSFANAARSDNEVAFSVLWDAEAVYIGADVVDASLESDGEQLYQDVGLELFVDANKHDSASEVFHFKANILGEVEGGVLTSAATETSTGYTMEVRIPWTTLGVAPSEGMRLGFLVGNNDRDQGGSSQFDWMDLIETSGGYFRADLYGDLALSGVADCSCVATAEICDDGLDNDCDGDVDTADVNCQGNTDVDVVCPENHIVVNPEAVRPDEFTVVINDKDGNPVTCARVALDLEAAGCSAEGGFSATGLFLLASLWISRRRCKSARAYCESDLVC
ncbi:MAG: sugar-binding protein [Myxococcota bacterium]